jgi:hypothetical protein
MDMDSTTLLFIVGPMVLGLVFNAPKLMRMVGFVARGGKQPSVRGRGFDHEMSFDERVAERLRELDRERR